MFYTFSISDSFDIEIGSAQNGTKTLLLDMGVWINKIKAEYPGVHLRFNIKLEQLDLSYKLPGLAEAPFPPLQDLETRAERSTALLNQWRTYASIGLRIYTAARGGNWVTAGTLPLQNHGSENWQPILTPFLTSATEVYLLSERTRIGIELIDNGYGLLKANDRLTFRGGFIAEVSAWEREVRPINNRRNLGINLFDGVATNLLSYNLNRKYLYLTNTGNTPVYFIFGTIIDLTQTATIVDDKIVQSNGLLLTPNGSFNFNNNAFLEPSPLSAVAIGGNGRITLLEGS